MIAKLLKNEITEERTYFTLTLLTGLIGGLVAVFINKAVHYLSHTFHTDQAFTWESLAVGFLFVFVSGFVTTRYFPSTAGSGIPGVRVAIAAFNGKIKIGSTFAKLFTSILSLASGMSVGREGPTVAITAGIGSFFGEFLHMSRKRIKALAAIGSAAGLAAAFNTPIAAVVFTLEEVVGDLNAKMLGSIVISSVVAVITAGLLIGDHPTFLIPAYEFKDPRELIVYLAIGITAGFVGPLWVKSVLKLRKINGKIFKQHKLTNILLTFFIIAALSQVNTAVLGSGHHTVSEALLSHILDWKLLLFLFALKFFATTISYSSGISGGLFMPTLFMGSMLGGGIGGLSWLLFPEPVGSIGAYAIIGMGAYFVAVIRVPFTAIIMVFEMTQDYKVVLPLMIANVAAYFISTKMHKGSVYESISEQDGIHLPSHDDNEVLETLVIEDAMIREPICLNANLKTKEAFKLIRGNNISGYPVLKNGSLMGMVTINELSKAHAKFKGKATLEEFCVKKIFTIYADQSLLVAFDKIKRFNVGRIPVVSRINDKRIIGIITAEDIVNRFGYHIQKEQKNVDLHILEAEDADEERMFAEEEEK